MFHVIFAGYGSIMVILTPDIFDRIFHITRGGISKASKTINLNQDIFAGS